LLPLCCVFLHVLSIFFLPCDTFSRDIQRATSNFTTIIGNGAFGPVYKAQMATGETVAVKVLGTNSRQGEQEFLTEVNGILSFLLMCLYKLLFYFVLSEEFCIELGSQ